MIFGKMRRIGRILLLLCLIGLLAGCLGKGKISSVIDNALGQAFSQEEDPLDESGRASSSSEEESGEETSEEENPETVDNASDVTDTATEEDVPHVSDQCYAYSMLDAETKQVYDEVYDAILHFEKDVEVSTHSIDVLDVAFTAVRADYGELFWFDGYTYTVYTDSSDQVTKMTFSPIYTMTETQKEAYAAAVEEAAAGYLAFLSEDETDYDKALHLFRLLITNVSYNIEAQENQNVLSVFLYGETVCRGYAAAYQYLCTLAGIECCVVEGVAGDETHAWNLVRLDGEYYYVDVTWGNASYARDSGEDISDISFIDYAYFGFTTEEMQRSHEPYGTFTLPVCTATADSYYVHEGLYVAEWDADTIGSLLAYGYNNGTSVGIKFASYDLLDLTMAYFIDESHIVDYCPGITSASYIREDSMYVLLISFG